jgi:hypothetical protein
MKSLSRVLRVTGLVALVWTAGALAAEPVSEPAADHAEEEQVTKAELLDLIEVLAEKVDVLQDELNKVKNELGEEKEKVNALVTRLRALSTPKPATTAGSTAPASVPAPPQVAKDPAPASPSVTVPAASSPTQESPTPAEEVARIERERAIQSVSRSGVLLAPGDVEIEPSVTYQHASSNVINIDGFALLPILIVGEIESLRLERDIFIPSFNARVGALPNLQLDVSVPYKWERDRFVTQTQTDPTNTIREERTVTDHGIGDVSFGMTYQAMYEEGLRPDVLLSARAIAPTGKSIFDIGDSTTQTNVTQAAELPLGKGVWGVRGGVTAIKAIDPVVLIFNAGYTHYLGRDFTVLVREEDEDGFPVTRSVDVTYRAGGTIDYGVAVAVAMNPVFAVNLQLQQRYTMGTELSGVGEVEGSAFNEADLRFGFAWALTKNTLLNFSVAAGLTEDTPDLTVTLALPIKF